MELLEKKYESTCKAITRFMEFMEKPEEVSVGKLDVYSEEEFYIMRRDSLIKRFEFSLDTLWKYLKLYLEKVHGLEEKSPRMVFRACVKVEILTPKQGELALEMVGARNQASHIYKEEIADIILKNLPRYLNLMKTCVDVSRPTP